MEYLKFVYLCLSDIALPINIRRDLTVTFDVDAALITYALVNYGEAHGNVHCLRDETLEWRIPSCEA